MDIEIILVAALNTYSAPKIIVHEWYTYMLGHSLAHTPALPVCRDRRRPVVTIAGHVADHRKQPSVLGLGGSGNYNHCRRHRPSSAYTSRPTVDRHAHTYTRLHKQEVMLPVYLGPQRQTPAANGGSRSGPTEQRCGRGFGLDGWLYNHSSCLTLADTLGRPTRRKRKHCSVATSTSLQVSRHDTRGDCHCFHI